MTLPSVSETSLLAAMAKRPPPGSSSTHCPVATRGEGSTPRPTTTAFPEPARPVTNAIAYWDRATLPSTMMAIGFSQ